MFDSFPQQVTLPQLLVWYRSDFVSEGRKDAKEYESLLEFVSSQVDEDLASDLALLLDLYGSSPKTAGEFNIYIHCWSYG